MQYSLVAVISFLAAAASVSAGPAPIFMRDGCDIKNCVLTLGPSVVGCASAVAQLGADPFSDAGCLLSAAKQLSDFPESCAGCLEQFGVDPADIAKVTEPVGDVVDSVEDAVGDAADKVGDFFGGLF
ncbi:CBP domain-containing protein [Mycena kentingensis (nom. inval.)]|nr:CBP domain-containing protein [Mycena kentingensis (nom. inval.)]